MRKHANRIDLVKSFQTNSNAVYLVANFGFDTAENEPDYGYGISLIFVSLIFGPACAPSARDPAGPCASPSAGEPRSDPAR